ncbi:MAG: acetyl-CoA acetyltransferase [bacterium]|nr:acetyl-CoA acetyltransferase [bacterium]
MLNPNTPVLVGVAQLLNRIEALDEALEPVEMMFRASALAERDTGASGVLKQIQSVRVIRGIWGYENPAAHIAERVGAHGAQTVGTLFGGNQNQAIINHTALEILGGELDLVLITGAENGYSASKARKAGVDLARTSAPGDYDLLIGSQKPEHHRYELAKGIQSPIQIYPMYENAIRFQRGETLSGHLERVSELWSRFNDVAQANPHAWVRQNVSAEQIRTPSSGNRAISFPYTKLMNANMMVDMGAALIMCSVGKAKQLGIDSNRWIYPLAGAQGYDHFSASVRDNFYTSPGIRITGARVLDLAQIEVGDLAFVDLYSCFPSAVQVAADELGLSQEDPLTVTGGLTFGGGPLNNYVMHSIARMVELLRVNPGARGLITANGGNLYKHAHGVYSSAPPERDFRFANVQAEIDALPARECLPAYKGDVTIESYTVMFSPDGPSIGHFSCLTHEGQRVWANTKDRDLLQAMQTEEFCGRPARLDEREEIALRS